MTATSQLSKLNLKIKNRNKVSQQLEQEQKELQKQRSQGGLSAGMGWGENGGKVQGIRSVIGRYKIDRGMLRVVQEMEKPKNLYV